MVYGVEYIVTMFFIYVDLTNIIYFKRYVYMLVNMQKVYVILVLI
jgi:hypothetical protein